MNMQNSNHLENMYPEVYNDLFPLVAQAADEIASSGQTPTENMINSYVDNMIMMSGMWDEDEPIEAMPVQAGFGSQPFRRERRRRHHNRNSLRDILRILLLRELLGRRDRRY